MKKGKALDRRVLWFLGLTFTITWGLLFFMLARGVEYGSTASLYVLTGCMFVPAACSILTRLITKEGFGDLMLLPRLKGKKNFRYYLLAAYAPVGFILVGAVLYFLLFPQYFDREFTVMKALIPEGSGVTVAMLLMAQLIQVLLIGPFVNILPTLGEELGWRGYLMPKLLKDNSVRASVIGSGIVWGVWHAPMIAMGHNYGTGYWGYPYTGVLLMTAFCVFFGMLLSYATLKTGSVLPAAVGHSSLNAAAAMPNLFLLPGASPLVGPLLMGIVPMIPLAVVCLLLLKRSEGLCLPGAANETESIPPEA